MLKKIWIETKREKKRDTYRDTSFVTNLRTDERTKKVFDIALLFSNDK